MPSKKKPARKPATKVSRGASRSRSQSKAKAQKQTPALDMELAFQVVTKMLIYSTDFLKHSEKYNFVQDEAGLDISALDAASQARIARVFSQHDSLYDLVNWSEVFKAGGKEVCQVICSRSSASWDLREVQRGGGSGFPAWKEKLLEGVPE